MSGNLSWRQIFEELFGKKEFVYNSYFPQRLDFSCNRMPTELNIANYIIKNNTILPLHKPFLKRSIIQRIKSEIYGEHTNADSETMARRIWGKIYIM